MAYIIGLGALLVLSAFFSGSETALFSLSRGQVQQLLKSGTKSGRRVGALLDRPRRLLVTILVGNMSVNVATASILGALASRLLGNKGVGAAIFVTTFLLLIAGEVTPKTLAVRHAERFARCVAGPIQLFSILIWPVRVVLIQFTSAILFVLRQGHVQSENLLTPDDIQALAKAGESEGVVQEHETEIVQNIFELRDIIAREVMVPRTDIVRVSEDATVQEALTLSCQSGHSRIPVYNEADDEISGVFQVKDIPAWVDHHVQGLSIRDFVARRDSMTSAPRFPLVHPAFLVPETCRIDALLQAMRTHRTHVAILLDEYGGTAGMVTLGDLLECLVGELVQEEPGESRDYARRGDVITASGQARIRELNHDMDLDIPLGRIDTVGGYVVELLGRLPEEGQTVSDGSLVFTATKVGVKRIAQVEIRPAPQAEPHAEDPADG